MKLIDNMNLKWNIILSIILPLTFFVVILYYWGEESKKTQNEYPTIQNLNNFKGFITFKEKIMRGDQVKIKLDNNRQFILLHSMNDDYLPKNKLSDFMQIGDSIVKTSGTDSLFLYRNDNVYYFVVSKRIDKSGNFY